MADLKITDLVDQKDIDKLHELNKILATIKENYAGAAKELVVAIKLNVDKYEDLNKLSAIINSSMVKAQEANDKLNVALVKQAELTAKVAGSLDKQIESGNLSATQMKKLTDASKKNAESLEKLAKAEATVEKAQKASNTTKKSTNVTEQERQKIIADAIAATHKEIHSIQEANDMNKQLRRAVKLVRDTDEEYIQTVGRLNSTIGVNTDYVKRNSDRYTQQKMTIGDYTESVKRAWMEIQRGNSSMKSMGIIAKSTGNLLKTSFSSGVNQVTVGVGSMIKGMVGAQAIIGGIQKLFTLFKDGVRTAIDFEAANSKLAAILGTTRNGINDLTIDARRLGETTKYTASEATSLQVELAKLGFTAREIKDSTEYILRFAQATGADLSESAALAGAALRMFGADTKETERYVSAMAVATTKSALSFSYLQTAMPIVGPVAKSFNFTIEDTVALLGKLADSGFDASSAATATRNILLNLADSSGKLAQSLGKPVKSLPELVEGLKSLKEKGVDLNTTLELTDKRSVAAFNAFLTAVDKIIPLREQVTGCEEDLDKMAKTMGDNVQGAIFGLSSAWDEFMITINESNGWMKAVIDWCTELVRGLSKILASVDTLQGKMTSQQEIEAVNQVKKAKVVENYESKILEMKKRYMKQGMDADTADAQARKSFIDNLQQQLNQENKIIKKAKEEQQAIKEKEHWYNRALLVEQKDGTFKTYKEMELEQARYIATAKGNIAKLNYIMDNLKKSPDSSNNNTSGNFGLTGKELEKHLKEQQKIKEKYQQSELALMNEGLDKQIKSISLNYSKQIAAIRGNSDDEIATKKNLAEKMEKEISDAKIKFALDAEKRNLSNRIAIVEKDTKEELDLKMRMLDLERKGEINVAEKSGEDVFLIDEKYKKKRQDLLEEFASKQILLIANNAAAEQAVRDRQFQSDMLDLKKRRETENMSEEQYAEEEYRIKLDYVRKTTEAAIDSIEQELKVDNLSVKDRAKLAEELYKLKADLANKEADAEIEAIQKINKADEKSYKERTGNLKKWLQTASQAVGAIGDLVGTLYDGQMDKIEEESEANTEAHDAEVERIELLKEQKIISEDEAQARKRAAEAKTRKKEEELEKKRRDIQYKQAVWEKAMNISNIISGTALAVINALQTKPFIPAGLAAAAVAGTMGALQLATVMATPIPKYAKGTDSHIGGPAIVGDGGKKEIVLYGGAAWLTPDIPTIVDLPKGAEVLPDANRYNFTGMDFLNFNPQFQKELPEVVINNDFTPLNRELKGLRSDIRKMAQQQHRDAYDLNYERYKRNRL